MPRYEVWVNNSSITYSLALRETASLLPQITGQETQVNENSPAVLSNMAVDTFQSMPCSLNLLPVKTAADIDPRV